MGVLQFCYNGTFYFSFFFVVHSAAMPLILMGVLQFCYNPKSEKVGTVWKTQIKKESSDF